MARQSDLNRFLYLSFEEMVDKIISLEKEVEHLSESLQDADIALDLYVEQLNGPDV